MSKNATFIQSFSIMSADNVDDDDPNQINEVKSESMWAMAKRDKLDIFNALKVGQMIKEPLFCKFSNKYDQNKSNLWEFVPKIKPLFIILTA